MKKDYFTVREFAKALGYDKRTILRYIKAGFIKAQKQSGGTKYLIPRKELIRWGLVTDDENDVDL
jgi:excisionase family DNA binding protein